MSASPAHPSAKNKNRVCLTFRDTTTLSGRPVSKRSLCGFAPKAPRTIDRLRQSKSSCGGFDVSLLPRRIRRAGEANHVFDDAMRRGLPAIRKSPRLGLDLGRQIIFISTCSPFRGNIPFNTMRSSIKALLPEPETPEQILAELRDLASNPAEFEQVAVLWEQLPRYEQLWDEIAEELRIHQLFQTLPNEEIAKHRTLPEDGEADKLRELVQERLLGPNREMLRKLPGWDEQDFLAHWCGVFRTAMMKEYLRRRDQNETEDGRLIRELLVAEPERKRPETLRKAAKALTNGLFFLGEGPRKSEDAPAEAILQILERVNAFVQASPVASNPVAIQAFMEGTLNKIPDQARSHVRTVIETENRRLKLYDRNDGSQRQFDPKEKKQLVEMVPDTRPSQEEKLLFEEVLVPLELRDRELAFLYFIEERTQQEIATDYGLTQGAVCKRLEAIRSALKVIREDQSGSSAAR